MAVSKTVLVTGGNRGIGYEICRQMARTGFDVWLAARSMDKAQQAAESLAADGKVHAIAIDVASEQSIHEAAAMLCGSLEQLDGLINNAGVFLDTNREGMDFTREALLGSFETNTLGPLFLTRALLPLLKKSPSAQVVNMSSGMGQLDDMRDGHAAYRISKTGLNAVTRILSAELSDTSICVNSMCPGWVKTDMGGKGAPLTIEQGADTAVWLASGGAGRSTGLFYRARNVIAW